MVIMKYVQRQFVYFIAVICRNSLKDILVSFYKEKQSEALHSLHEN